VQYTIKTAYNTLLTNKSKLKHQSGVREKIHSPEFRDYRKALNILRMFNKIENSEDKQELDKLSGLIANFNRSRTITWKIVDHNNALFNPKNID